MSEIVIVGSGMAGLLAGNMLRDHSPLIIEAASALPNNHSAVLRFRSSIVSDTLRVPFKKVKVAKGSISWRNPVADSMAYSYKTNGTYRSDRSITSTNNELSERYIAPPNLISVMAEKLNISYGEKFNYAPGPAAVISTMPMPSLMDILGYADRPEFKFIHGFNITADLKYTDAYLSLYVPDPSLHCNRISVTGSKLIIEYSFPGFSLERTKDLLRQFQDPSILDEQVEIALEAIGINKKVRWVDFKITPEIKLQTYSKILPIDEDERRHFINWATEKHNIYSLGRYAVWKPGLLLDDLVNDIRLIEHWITRKDNYSRNKHAHRKQS